MKCKSEDMSIARDAEAEVQCETTNLGGEETKCRLPNVEMLGKETDIRRGRAARPVSLLHLSLLYVQQEPGDGGVDRLLGGPAGAIRH